LADTFYGAAPTATGDPAHIRAMEMSRTVSPSKIVTTEEVPAEYLAFFCAAAQYLRREAVSNVQAILHDRSGWRGYSLTAP